MKKTILFIGSGALIIAVIIRGIFILGQMDQNQNKIKAPVVEQAFFQPTKEPELSSIFNPQNLPPEVVVVKSPYGNLSLTPDLSDPLSVTNQEQGTLPTLHGLSNQEVSLFVKPDGDVFEVVGQILYIIDETE